MSLGFAFVLAALGLSLIYKGMHGYTWPQFYDAIFKGTKTYKPKGA